MNYLLSEYKEKIIKIDLMCVINKFTEEMLIKIIMVNIRSYFCRFKSFKPLFTDKLFIL